MKVKGNRFTWHIHLAHPKKEMSARNFFALTSKRTDHMAHMKFQDKKLFILIQNIQLSEKPILHTKKKILILT